MSQPKQNVKIIDFKKQNVKEGFRVTGGDRICGQVPKCVYGHCHKHTVEVVDFSSAKHFDLTIPNIRL